MELVKDERDKVITTKLEITIVARNNSWVGIILGGGKIMREGNDLIVVSANGKQSYCLDKHTNGTTDLKDDPQ